MKWPNIQEADPDKPPAPLYIRLLWLAGIWAASVGVLVIIGLFIRLVLLPG